MGGNAERTHDTEMHILATDQRQHGHNTENEKEVLRALEALDFLAIDREGGEVLGNQDVLGVQEHAVAQIDEANKMGEILGRLA